MKCQRILATVCVAVAFFSLMTCAAQDNAIPIVVVDLGQVFDQHPTFKAEIDRIKATVKSTEANFQARSKEIENRVNTLKSYDDPSSAEYKQLEMETARMQAQIQADMTLKRKDFLEQEARAYYATYQEVRQEIKTFAESNRIGLVLRFSSEEIDPSNRQSVLQGVNQPIVYNQGGLDITRYIVERLLRKSTAAQRTARAGAAPPATSQPRR